MNQMPVTPAYVRITHWINAISVIVMIMSGLKIYNASPIFDFLIPNSITIGGWLGGALLWHFAAMWVMVINGLLYLILNLATKRAFIKLLSITPTGLMNDLMEMLMGKLSHDDLSQYNAIQKLAYVSIILDLIILVLSGLVVWKSVQFPILRELMGGFDNARIVHFCCMTFAVFFLVIHLVMVALVPKTLLVMLRGKA
jgi:thiosulfate reductase cytochrome b subunit